VKTLKQQLEAAEALIKPIAAKAQPDRQEKQFLERMKFTRLSFNLIEGYIAMTTAAATETDFKAAAAAGERALATRLELANMNPTFTTRVVGVAAESDKSNTVSCSRSPTERRASSSRRRRWNGPSAATRTTAACRAAGRIASRT